MTDLARISVDGRCDAFLLGRLGHELGLIYHDTLQAPLPTGLKMLIDRLDQSLRTSDRPAPDTAARS